EAERLPTGSISPTARSPIICRTSIRSSGSPAGRSCRSCSRPPMMTVERHMTPKQITLVRVSLHRASANATTLVGHFYQHLFELDPDARSLFSTDPQVLQAKFFMELDAIVTALPS